MGDAFAETRGGIGALRWRWSRRAIPAVCRFSLRILLIPARISAEVGSRAWAGLFTRACRFRRAKRSYVCALIVQPALRTRIKKGYNDESSTRPDSVVGGPRATRFLRGDPVGLRATES